MSRVNNRGPYSRSFPWNNQAGAVILLAVALGAGAVFAGGRTLWQDGGVQLCGPSAEGDPLATSDGAGGAIVMWTDGRNGPSGIYAQRVDASGVSLWTEDGILVCDSTGQNPLGVIGDGEHGAITVWALYRDPLVVQRVSADGVPLWGLNGLVLRPQSESLAECPALVQDGHSGAIVVWTTFSLDFQLDTLIACRVDSSGSKLWETVVRIDTLGDMPPSLCSDGLGGVVIAWSEGNLGPVRVQRVDSMGTIKWDSAGVLACTLSTVKAARACVAVGGSRFVVSFAVVPGWHHRGQMFDLAGNRLWGLTGVPASGGYNAPSGSVVLPSGIARQAVWIWTEDRTGTDDLFAQKLDSAGHRCWDTTGVWVGTTDTADGYPFSATVDGKGGAIAVWPLFHTDRNSDLCAQHVDSAGYLRWSDTGLAVCRDTDNQRRTPAVVSDGDGGAIIAWLEWRWGEGSAICAQRVIDVVGVEESYRPQASRHKPEATVVSGVLFLAEATSRKPQAASLLDACGREVMVLHGGANDVVGLAPGVYFVIRAQAQAVQKVVVTR